MHYAHVRRGWGGHVHGAGNALGYTIVSSSPHGELNQRAQETTPGWPSLTRSICLPAGNDGLWCGRTAPGQQSDSRSSAATSIYGRSRSSRWVKHGEMDSALDATPLGTGAHHCCIGLMGRPALPSTCPRHQGRTAVTAAPIFACARDTYRGTPGRRRCACAGETASGTIAVDLRPETELTRFALPPVQRLPLPHHRQRRTRQTAAPPATPQRH